MDNGGAPVSLSTRQETNRYISLAVQQQHLKKMLSQIPFNDKKGLPKIVRGGEQSMNYQIER